MQTAQATAETRLVAVEDGVRESKGLVERIVKIETTMPFVTEALQRIEKNIGDLGAVTHRIELSVAQKPG